MISMPIVMVYLQMRSENQRIVKNRSYSAPDWHSVEVYSFGSFSLIHTFAKQRILWGVLLIWRKFVLSSQNSNQKTEIHPRLQRQSNKTIKSTISVNTSHKETLCWCKWRSWTGESHVMISTRPSSFNQEQHCDCIYACCKDSRQMFLQETVLFGDLWIVVNGGGVFHHKVLDQFDLWVFY